VRLVRVWQGGRNEDKVGRGNVAARVVRAPVPCVDYRLIRQWIGLDAQLLCSSRMLVDARCGAIGARMSKSNG